ncbi:hypothetical protein RJ639_035554 [Escallonia herrerae]|uniref:Reverse transcriptase Ty1/copia-type domain-containing protein n=1 Tax=Escallonia herrerae TaxID=1293975 RepID=A0AA88WQM4_9ASTE|nr:hypothetical protein RJ639_035554 [Escallonia herrerae]
MDHYRCIEMKCSDDAAVLKNSLKRIEVMIFSPILRKEELPSLNETISIINAEESRRGVMLYAQPVEESTMLGKIIDKNPKFNAEKTSASHTVNSEAGRMESQPLSKDKMWCTYCKKPRHTKEQYWKLHGKPPSSHWNAGPRSEKLRSQVHMTQSREDLSHADVNSSGREENGFNKEDIGRLRSLLDSLEKSKGTWHNQDQVTRRRMIGHAREDTSSMEDKNLFLREPSMLVKTSPVQTKSTPKVELISRGDSEAEPIESFPNLSKEPSRPKNPTLTMPLKVFLRRIKPVINPVQVQETESSLGMSFRGSYGVDITGNDSDEKEALRKYLAKEFEIKDLGKLKYFLGIEVAQSKEGIFVSQQKYVLDLLEETSKLGCRPSDTPIEPNHRPAEFMEGEPTDKGMYQRLVGKLIYLSHTRPDIANAVSVVSQFMQNPKDGHLHAVYQILQYLKGSPGRGILFRKGTNMELEAYIDADYAGSFTYRRSTSGYCTFLGGNLVTWRSKKQPVVARSSLEAEFRSMAQEFSSIFNHATTANMVPTTLRHHRGDLRDSPLTLLGSNQFQLGAGARIEIQ